MIEDTHAASGDPSPTSTLPQGTTTLRRMLENALAGRPAGVSGEGGVGWNARDVMIIAGTVAATDPSRSEALDVPLCTMFANEQDRLEAWLSAMDFELDIEFQDELPDDFPFDFTRESLLALEAFILDHFETEDDVDSPDHKELVDRIARYVGETFRRSFPDASWIPGDDHHDLLPLVKFEWSAIPEAPFFLVYTVVDRRTGTLLSEIYDGLAAFRAERIPAP